MVQVDAVMVAKLGGSKLADDESTLLLEARREDGNAVVISVPSDQLGMLVEAAAYGSVRSQRLRNQDPNWREFFRTSRWELGRDAASGVFILSLTFGAGGRLSFSLPDPMPDQILETLVSMKERTALARPATTTLN